MITYHDITHAVVLLNGMYIHVFVACQAFIEELEKKIGGPLAQGSCAVVGMPQEALTSSAPKAATVADLHSATYQASLSGFRVDAVVCKKNESVINFWRTTCIHDCISRCIFMHSHAFMDIWCAHIHFRIKSILENDMVEVVQLEHGVETNAMDVPLKAIVDEWRLHKGKVPKLIPGSACMTCPCCEPCMTCICTCILRYLHHTCMHS